MTHTTKKRPRTAVIAACDLSTKMLRASDYIDRCRIPPYTRFDDLRPPKLIVVRELTPVATAVAHWDVEVVTGRSWVSEDGTHTTLDYTLPGRTEGCRTNSWREVLGWYLAEVRAAIYGLEPFSLREDR